MVIIFCTALAIIILKQTANLKLSFPLNSYDCHKALFCRWNSIRECKNGIQRRRGRKGRPKEKLMDGEKLNVAKHKLIGEDTEDRNVWRI